MGNLQFTNTDWGGFEPSRVARELLGQFMARGCYAHILCYHADIFIDYEEFTVRLNVSGIYFIREMGTHTIFLEQFKTMTGEQTLLEYTKAMLQTIGTRMTRAFLIVDTTDTRGNREILVEEFNPQYRGDVERVVKTLEGLRI